MWLVVAQGYSQLGRSAPAIKCYNRAYKAGPPVDARSGICLQLVELELRLSHGHEALKTLEALTRISANPEERPSIRFLWFRSAALMLLDRYDQCLACIEQLLQITDGDPDANSRLLLAHVRLAELTRQRGWNDECVSQIERVLARLTTGNRSLQARMHLLRAQSLCSIGDIDGARRDCSSGLNLSKEPIVRERAAIVQSAILLAQDHIPEALNALESALRETEGDIEIQYAYAMTLRAHGDDAAAAEILKNLAAAFPQEHWGRLAAETLVAQQ